MLKKKALFLCNNNACRSQMAEGLLRNIAGERFKVFSAGIEPTEVHPLAVRAMAEIGIDISRQRSKPVTEFSEKNFDYVVTVCDQARQACPLFPGDFEKIHWDLEDPVSAGGTEEERLAVFRKVRDQVREAIKAFLSREA